MVKRALRAHTRNEKLLLRFKYGIFHFFAFTNHCAARISRFHVCLWSLHWFKSSTSERMEIKYAEAPD